MEDAGRGPQIRILIAEDESVVRWALRRFLESHGLEVVGETGSAKEAVRLASELKPDATLMDLQLNDGNGIGATSEIVRQGCGQVLAFSAHGSREHVEAFLKAGGKGFASKFDPVTVLTSGIRAVADGGTWVSPRVRQNLEASIKPGAEMPLSPRELEVASLVVKGYSNAQISERLFISAKTVDTHRSHIFRKLGIHSKTELIEYMAHHSLWNDR